MLNFLGNNVSYLSTSQTENKSFQFFAAKMLIFWSDIADIRGGN